MPKFRQLIVFWSTKYELGDFLRSIDFEDRENMLFTIEPMTIFDLAPENR